LARKLLLVESGGNLSGLAHMAEIPERENQTRPAFAPSFRGYNRDDVDAYLTSLERQKSQLEEELRMCREERSAATKRLADKESQFESAEKEHRDWGAISSELTLLQEEYEHLRAEHNRVRAEHERTLAEMEALKGDSVHIQEVLLVAHKAATDLKGQARTEAEAVIREAEIRAVRLDEETRQRMRDLSFQLEQARRDYEEFLSTARNMAHSFIRKIDETRGRS